MCIQFVDCIFVSFGARVHLCDSCMEHHVLSFQGAKALPPNWGGPTPCWVQVFRQVYIDLDFQEFSLDFFLK